MSKQDSHFFNLFSVVLGILISVTVVLIGIARAVGANTQLTDVVQDARHVAAVDERVRPLVRVAVAGRDNSAMTIKEDAPGGPVNFVLPVPKDATALYESVCKTCHGAGIGGAPKAGDKGAWGPRMAQGNAMLYKHALEGYSGKVGVMPAKGGRIDLTDELIKAGVDHMLGIAK